MANLVSKLSQHIHSFSSRGTIELLLREGVSEEGLLSQDSIVKSRLSIVEVPGCRSSELHVRLLVERDDDNVHLLVNSF